MPRLSKAHDHARRRLSDLAAAGLPPKRLSSQIAGTLQEAIGWDGYRMFGLDRKTLLINGLLGASENDAAARLEWLREVYLAMPTPYAELPDLARRGHRAVAFQERQHECWGYTAAQLAPVGPQDHYRHYHEGQSPVGGAILAIFRNDGQAVAAMQAYRRDPQRQFRATDVQFVQQVSPLIGRALASATTREEALLTASAEATAASGILLVGEGGEVRFATPAAERWLDVIADAGDGLPMSVLATMTALRRNDHQAAAVAVPSAQGRVRVEASASGQPGVAAIVIAAEAPPALPEVPASWGLTPQERAVVMHLASGRANAEIAAAMFIGEHTVEWHLRRVYDKLGVRTRQQVISALFRQAMLPGIAREVLGQQ